MLKILGYLIAFSILPCVVLMYRKHTALAAAEKCPGVVTGHERRSGSKGSTYALKIDYQDRRGETRTFITESSSSPAACAIGDDVTVFHYADGRTPNVLVFSDLYLGYWIWFSISASILGCLAAPAVLQAVYGK